MIEWREKSNLPPPPPRKKIRPKNDITRCTLFADLHARDTQALPRNFRLFCLPEQSLLKSSVPPSPRPPPPASTKKNAQFAYPKKSQGQKFRTNPNSSFIPVSWNPEYPVPPGTEIHRPEYNIVCYSKCFIFTYFLSSPYSSSVSSCSLNCAQ